MTVKDSAAKFNHGGSNRKVQHSASVSADLIVLSELEGDEEETTSYRQLDDGSSKTNQSVQIDELLQRTNS